MPPLQRLMGVHCARMSRILIIKPSLPQTPPHYSSSQRELAPPLEEGWREGVLIRPVEMKSGAPYEAHDAPRMGCIGDRGFARSRSWIWTLMQVRIWLLRVGLLGWGLPLLEISPSLWTSLVCARVVTVVGGKTPGRHWRRSGKKETM